MGYSRIYGIKGNLSNSTLYRCKGKLLVDPGYAALSKAVLYTIISTRGSLPLTRLVYLLASSQTCCSLKDQEKTAKRQTKLGTPASRP